MRSNRVLWFILKHVARAEYIYFLLNHSFLHVIMIVIILITFAACFSISNLVQWNTQASSRTSRIILKFTALDGQQWLGSSV